MNACEYVPHKIEWTPDRVTNLWEYYGTNPAYENAYFSMHSGRPILAFTERHIPLSGRRVLDFGCGRGHLLQHLLVSGVACQGLEFSLESAAEATRNVGLHPLFGGVVHAEAIPTPLPDGTIDVVFLIEVLEHLFDDQLLPTIRDIHRILRPGGHIVATTPHAENLDANMLRCPECGCTFHRWQHMRRVTMSSISALMSEVGFERLLCQAVHFDSAASRASRLLAGLQRLYRQLRGKPADLPHLIYLGQNPKHVLQ